MTHPAITSARKQTRACLALIDKLVADAELGLCPLCLEPMPPPRKTGRKRKYCMANEDCQRTYSRLYGKGKRKVYPERERETARRGKKAMAERRSGVSGDLLRGAIHCDTLCFTTVVIHNGPCGGGAA